MPMTYEERAFLDKALAVEMKSPRGKNATLLRLAAELAEELEERAQNARVAYAKLLGERNATARALTSSTCFRVTRFFKGLYARVCLWL